VKTFTVWQKPTRRSRTSVSNKIKFDLNLSRKGGFNSRLFSLLKQGNYCGT
jgi:hypothetical protein